MTEIVGSDRKGVIESDGIVLEGSRPCEPWPAETRALHQKVEEAIAITFNCTPDRTVAVVCDRRRFLCGLRPAATDRRDQNASLAGSYL